MNSIIRRRGTPEFHRCAFTGYRPQKMPWGFDEDDSRCVAFKQRMSDTIEELVRLGYKHFLSGGANGMDMYAAEAVLALKRIYPELILEMVSPCDGQAAFWDAEAKARHDRLFEDADIVTVISHKYSDLCMTQRNRYLVENADLLLAAFDGQPGGTSMTVSYAKQLGVPIIRLRPDEAKAA